MFAKYVEIGSHAIHYLHTGPSTLPDVPPALDRGALLVFLHASGGTANLWRPQLEHFEARHSALALDFPGHGRSAGVAGLAAVEDHAALLEALAARLGLRPVVAVGRSLGAAAAIALARRAPRRVRGLVLLGTGPGIAAPSETLAVLRDVVHGRRPQHFSTDVFSRATGMEIMRRVWAEQVKTDPRVAYADHVACAAFDLAAAAATVAVPTLVVGGADDRVAPPEAVAALARLIPGAALAMIPEAGQMLAVERAAEINRVVEAFVDELP